MTTTKGNPKLILGLVGGMGSGKSLVAKVLAEYGGVNVAGDRLGHEALEQPAIRARVMERWGDRIRSHDGGLDRHKLGDIVFASPVERAALEHLLFPWIERRIGEETAKANADPKCRFVVLDAAIMLEAGWGRVCDVLVYVHAPREQRLARVAAQRGWTAEQLALRESAQMPLTIKASLADVAVDNSGDDAHLRGQVARLMSEGVLARLSQAV